MLHNIVWNKSEGGLITVDIWKTTSPLLIFIIAIHTNTCHLLISSTCNLIQHMKLTLYNTNKFKWSHALVVGERWGHE
jgi:hypothetical protein